MAVKFWIGIGIAVIAIAAAYWYWGLPGVHFHAASVIRAKRGLHSPFAKTRVAAAKDLTYQNCSLEVAEDDLREALTDSNPEVRMLCAISLLQISENDQPALDTLLECLKLDDKEVVLKTIMEMGHSGMRGIRLDQHPITHLIFDMYESGDPELHETAAWYLSYCHDRQVVVERTMQLLGNEKAKDYNLGALISVAGGIENGYLTYAQANRLLSEGNTQTQAGIVKGLGGFREGIPAEIIPAVLKIAENAEYDLAISAASYLGSTKGLPDTAIETVAQLLQSPDEHRRGLALNIISLGEGGLKERGARFTPELMKWLFNDPGKDTGGQGYKDKIFYTLLSMGPEAVGQLNQFVLRQIAEDPEKLDDSAMFVLKQMGSQAEPAIPQLIVLMGHYSQGTADTAAWTLTAINPGIPEVISYATGLTNHKFDFRRSEGRELLEANGFKK